MIETVVFDIGNVLIDWDPRYLYRKVFDNEEEMERFLANIATPEWHIEQDRGRTMEEATEILVSRHPEHAREIEAYYGRWEEMFGGPIGGSVEVLREMRDLGYPLHALTNWSAQTFPLAREWYGFLDIFEEIVVSGEEGRIKPDPALYEILIQRTDLDPFTTVFIDDSPPNARTAEDLGFTALWFQNAKKLRTDLENLGVLQTPKGAAYGA